MASKSKAMRTQTRTIQAIEESPASKIFRIEIFISEISNITSSHDQHPMPLRPRFVMPGCSRAILFDARCFDNSAAVPEQT
jgi:hypothetical protein